MLEIDAFDEAPDTTVTVRKQGRGTAAQAAERRQTIVRMLAEGNTQAHIARVLGVSPGRVNKVVRTGV